MSDYSDIELLAIIKDPERRDYGFNLLVRQYQKRVYWHIRRIVIDHDDANDVVQNVFIKIWKSIDAFRGDSQLFTWMYRIATNESLTFLKQKKTSFFVPFGDAENELSNNLSDDNFFKGDEIQRKLQKAILTLPEKQRLVFNMKYFEEMKYEEMSQVLGTSVGALKASFHLAVKKIEKYLTAL